MGAVIGFSVYQLGSLSRSLTTALQAIYPPGNWMGMTLVNGSGQTLTLATDADDPNTEVDVPDGTQFMIQALFGPPSSLAYRFQPQQIAFYLKAASGDGTGAYIVWA